MPKTQEEELEAGLLEPDSIREALRTESEYLRTQWNNLGSPGPPIHPALGASAAAPPAGEKKAAQESRRATVVVDKGSSLPSSGTLCLNMWPYLCLAKDH